MPKIVIAIDSYKGCLSSREACHAAAQGVLEARPECKIVEVPVSDGGEGLTEVLVSHMKGRYVNVTIPGPLGDPTSARYGISADGTTAIMEMASACGLPLLSPERHNPELTSTFGFGRMLADALSHGCRHFIIGIGGSATNDAGLGMIQALGAEFYDSEGHIITQPLCGRLLTTVAGINRSSLLPALIESDFLVACDVQNPLFGPQGAAYVFAPQKGADADMVLRLDAGLRHIASIAGCSTSCPGDGAAGGLGFALRHFLNAEMRPGIDLVLDTLQFDQLLCNASLVLTGEGHSDSQTLMGKVPQGVMLRARRMGLPVHLLSGDISDCQTLLNAGFTACHNINEGDDSPLDILMRHDVACSHLKSTASNITTHTDLDQHSVFDFRLLLPIISIFLLLGLAYGLFYLLLKIVFGS